MCGSPKKRRYLQVLLHSPGGSIYAKAINSSYFENQYQAREGDLHSIIALDATKLHNANKMGSTSILLSSFRP